jgi:AmmeMemoRadiSam system protein B
VAGAFYPAEPNEVERMLDRMFAQPPRPELWPGVMVPHAGWMYSGRLAAATYSRVEIPDRVIILAPKHRAEGAEWAVAPHQTWSLPGHDLASDPELAARLAEGIEGLELDAAAHRREHSIEVQLPLLARLAPEVGVVGVAMHGGSYEELCRFAEQLADVIRSLPDRPLLVISTDMNHFADDAQTRRLDELALEAIRALDPERLYRTVRDNHISMCGLVPAVTVMETLRRLEGLTRCEQVGYATSADVSGDTSRVVGYAGVLLA